MLHDIGIRPNRWRRGPKTRNPVAKTGTFDLARSRDIFWLKDDSLADSASLPDSDVLAAEIVEDLQAALDEFALIAADLRVK